MAFVTFVVTGIVGGPEEIVRQAIVLGDSDPSKLLVYVFCAVVAAVVTYAILGVMISLDTGRDGGGRRFEKGRGR